MVRNLSVTKFIKCNFDAEQWDLYTHSFDEQEISLIAMDLNRLLEHKVNTGCDKGNTYNDMFALMKKYSKYGALDSEPLWFLEKVLEEVYDR